MRERPRIIPVLLLRGTGLYKTTRFSDATYVGDPINAVRVFNDKEVDELVVLDIGSAGSSQDQIPYALLKDVAGECFMPLCFGGGIRSVDQVRRLVHLGVEKVALNTGAVDSPDLVRESARLFGRQAVVGSIDVRTRADGRATVHVNGGRRDTGLDPVAHAQQLVADGAGEILLTSVDREGTRSGLDVELVARVSASVDVPVVAHGGAGSVSDLAAALRSGASAVAAGSLFVHYGKYRAVLITYVEAGDRDVLQS